MSYPLDTGLFPSVLGDTAGSLSTERACEVVSLTLSRIMLTNGRTYFKHF